MNLRDIWAAAFARGEARGVEVGAAFRADVAERLDDAREEREARIRAEAYAQGREAGLAARTPAGITSPEVERLIDRRVEQATRDATDAARFRGRFEAWHAMAAKLRAQTEPARAYDAASPIVMVLDNLRAWVENERDLAAKRARRAPEPCEVVPIRRPR